MKTLRMRRVQRRANTRYREDKFWTEKEKAARTAMDQASVEYDWARACIRRETRKDPAGEAYAYGKLRDAIRAFNVEQGWR